MSVYEIQIHAGRFLAMQLSALRSAPICSLEIPVGDKSVVVERIDFGPNSLRHSVPATFTLLDDRGDVAPEREAEGFATQIVQPVVVSVADLSDVLAHPNQAPATVLPVSLTLVLGLTFFTAGARPEEPAASCYLRTALDDVDWGAAGIPLPGPVRTAVQARLAGLVARTVPFNFADMFGPGTRIRNAGVSVDTALQRISFRAVPTGNYAKAWWERFYRGHFDDNLGDADWAVFVDAGILEGMFEVMLGGAMQRQSNADLHVINVYADYARFAGRARVTTTLNANYDVVTTGVGKIVKHIEADTRADFSMTTPGVLTTDVYLPDLEQLVGTWIGTLTMQITLGLMALCPPAAFVGLGLGLFAKGVAQDELRKEMNAVAVPAEFQKVDRLHYRSQRPIAPMAGFGAQLSLTRLEPLDNGMALRGDARIPPLTPSTVAIEIEGFDWSHPELSCDQASKAFVGSESSWDLLPLQARVKLTATGTTPVSLCDVRIRDGARQAAFGPGLRFDRGPLPTTIRLSASNRTGPHTAPLDLIVQTTAGTRLVRIPPPPPPVEEDREAALRRALERMEQCRRFTEAPRLRFDLRWLVDPPWDGRVEHVWEIEITGLAADQVLRLADAGDDELAAVISHEGGPVQLSALTAPAQGRELRVDERR